MKRTAFLFACIALLTSCGKVNPDISQNQILGTWILESSNGELIDTTDQNLTLTFRQDNTFEIVATTDLLTDTPKTETLRGSYFISGFQLSILYENNTTENVFVTLEGARMTFNDDFGNTTTYRR